jgi:hypothetical protein
MAGYSPKKGGAYGPSGTRRPSNVPEFAADAQQRLVENILVAKEQIKYTPLMKLHNMRTEITYYHQKINNKVNNVVNTGSLNSIDYNLKQFQKITRLTVLTETIDHIHLPDTVYDMSFEGELSILPNSIVPSIGDLFIMEVYNNKFHMFQVANITPTEIETNAAYRIKYVLFRQNVNPSTCETDLDVKLNVLKDEQYTFSYNHIGTEYRTILKNHEYEFVENTREIMYELSIEWIDRFYKRTLNTGFLGIDDINDEISNFINFEVSDDDLVDDYYRWIFNMYQSYDNMPWSISNANSVQGNARDVPAYNNNMYQTDMLGVKADRKAFNFNSVVGSTYGEDDIIYDPCLMHFVVSHDIFDMHPFIEWMDERTEVNRMQYHGSLFSAIEHREVKKWTNKANRLYLTKKNDLSFLNLLYGRYIMFTEPQEQGKTDFSVVPPRLQQSMDSYNFDDFTSISRFEIYKAGTANDILIDIIAIWLKECDKTKRFLAIEHLTRWFKECWIDFIHAEDFTKAMEIWYTYPIYIWIGKKLIEEVSHRRFD